MRGSPEEPPVFDRARPEAFSERIASLFAFISFLVWKGILERSPSRGRSSRGIGGAAAPAALPTSPLPKRHRRYSFATQLRALDGPMWLPEATSFNPAFPQKSFKPIKVHLQ